MTARPGPVLLMADTSDEAKWLSLRQQGVGASDVAAVVGVSPYAGPIRVWLQKTAGLTVPENAAMKWGKRFEDDVLEEFAESHPELSVLPKPGLFADGAAEWRLVTPDADAEGEEGADLVEIKTGMSHDDSWGQPDTDEVPIPYLCQVTWGCGIMLRPRWHLAVLLLDTREYLEYHGDFDAHLFERLCERVDRFWLHNVCQGIEPDADGLPDTTDLLNGRHRAKDKDVKVELPAEARLWAQSYAVNHHALDERETAKREAANLLRQHLAAASASVGLVNGEQIVTWRKPKPREDGSQGSPTLRVKGVSW